MLRNEGEAIAYLHRIVPRETMERLEHYAALLLKWQPAINLISPKDVPHLWQRHIADSAQLAATFLNHDSFPVVDIGSGGGLPGIIIGCVWPEHPILLVESDQRKTAFLFEAVRLLSLTQIQVRNARIEDVSDAAPRTISCRGFASIRKTLSLTAHLHHLALEYALLKGENYRTELQDAMHDWSFHVKTEPSITAANGYMIGLSDIRKREP